MMFRPVLRLDGMPNISAPYHPPNAAPTQSPFVARGREAMKGKPKGRLPVEDAVGTKLIPMKCRTCGREWFWRITRPETMLCACPTDNTPPPKSAA